MDPLTAKLETILAKFKTRLTAEEVEKFQDATLAQSQTELDRLQRKQHVTRQLMDMTRIQTFLETMDQFRGVLEHTGPAREFLAFIWGPMKYMLQVRSCLI